MERNEYIEGLRNLADFLEQNESLEMPYSVQGDTIAVFVDRRSSLQAWARAVPGRLDKQVEDSYYGFRLVGSLFGFEVTIYAVRENVCERVVVGTREEIVTEPDPEAVAALPQITHTKIIEDVEWICGPLFADEAVPA